MKTRGGYKKRTKSTKEQNPTILIVCEGSRTEPNYFNSFDVYGINVVTDGPGKNTDTLVEHAIDLMKKARKEGDPFDQVWCVFDRDSFPRTNFDRGLRLAQENNIYLAYSNEAFEIWYLLHFDKIDSALSRHQYEDKLSARIGRKYRKNDPDIYHLLLNKGSQDLAIRRANDLLSNYGQSHDPYRDNPCTTVFKLVLFLNKHLRK